jgi:serine/threonine-protein kinase
MCVGDYETALREYDRALEIDPHFYKAYAAIGRVYIQQGRFDEAIGILEQAHSLAGDLPIVLGALAQAHALAGRPAEARARLDQLRAIARERWVSSVTLALVHRALGEVSECLDLLEKACEQREVSVSLIALHPVYDSLRGERRFQALLRKMRLPESPPARRACP